MRLDRGQGRLRRVLALVLTVVVGVVGMVGIEAPKAAFAQYRPGGQAAGGRGLFTEATIVGVGDGRSVTGAIAPESFNPLNGYPAAIPPGSTTHDASFAGTIRIADPVTGRTGLTYCIDLTTDTENGVNYRIGHWSEANVPNMGYVEYILTHYYPTTNEPAGAATNADRAAAVQAAIWFFSDRYVLAPDSPIRALTQAIVADTLAHGPATEPAVPHLTVTPEHLPAPSTGQIVGPFTVSSDGPATIHLQGVEVFTDPNGQHPVSEGDTVNNGARLWARSVSGASPQGFVLERVVPVLVGTVMLYDGTNPGLATAQKLVLAQQTELVERAGVVLNRFEAGSLKVVKHITGTGAGNQGKIVIVVTCRAENPELNRRHIIKVPAGTPAGDHNYTVSGIAAGSLCAISEPVTGENNAVDLAARPVIDPTTVTVAAGQTSQVSVTDTFRPTVRAVPRPAAQSRQRQRHHSRAVAVQHNKSEVDVNLRSHHRTRSRHR